MPYTQKLDNLSKNGCTEVINKVLKFDATKAFDILAHAQFNKTALLYVGTSSTAGTLETNSANTTGVSTASNTSALNTAHVINIVDTMKERNIPAYTADDYMCVAHPTTFNQLKADLEGKYIYTDAGFNFIMNGEIGRYRGVRFVEQTNIAKETGGWGTGTNWAFFFGNDTVAEAIAIPEEMRGKLPTDYGRSKGIAWFEEVKCID